MKATIVFLISVCVITGSLFPQTMAERANRITKVEMQSVLEFLSDDLLEGRAPATRGGYLAERYMQSVFKLMDFQPGFNDQYLQPFTLKGFTIKELEVNVNDVALKYLDDIVGTWVGEERFDIEKQVVFVGFGITADRWRWDDYGKENVKNRIVIARVNDPGMYKDDIFEGSTLTYYGRWTYHIEEAARRGAAGILLIHTDDSAGYDWNVVKNSWSGEEVFLPSDLNSDLKFRGWIKESSLKQILATKNINLDDLYNQSTNRKFKPVPLGLLMHIRGESTQREALNHNVVAKIPGKTNKKIVISAHIDHLGKGKDNLPGQDTIFNGALDNSSAVASMMVTAKILKEFQSQLHFTIIVLACHSEEAGLLGSKYFVQNLSEAERKDTVTNINFESTPVWEATSDFMAVGARFSTLEDMLKQILAKEGLTYSYFSMSNQGFFYRSDQFSFARYGIPAIWISAGENDASGQKKYLNFWQNRYHTVKDEYNPNWPLDSMRQTIKMSVLLIDQINRTKRVPQWKANITFPMEVEVQTTSE